MGKDVFESEREFEPDEEVARKLKEDFQDSMFESELAIVLLTVIGAKPACDVEGFFKEKEGFQDFVGYLNSAGLNCYVEKNPESTMAESMMAVFNDETSESISEELDNAEVAARIFVSPERYQRGFFKLLFSDSYGPQFHRRYGEFLGFDEENIEAFTYRMMPGWRKFLYRLMSPRPHEDVSVMQMLKEYGEHLSLEEKKVFSAFTFQRMNNSEEMFEKCLERAENRKERVEEYGLDLNFFFENLADSELLEKFD